MRKSIRILCGAFIILFLAGVLIMDHRICLSAAPAGSAVPQQTQAEKRVAAMTLPEKAGQMFLVCVSNDTVSTEAITRYHPGGYLFFADFFAQRDPLRAAKDIASYQDASAVPMLMAVDEEGGSVTRISRFPAYRSAPFASPQQLFAQGGLDSIHRDTLEKCALLRSLGINVNLAPVCDLTDDRSAFIYPRTLGQDAKTTSAYIADVVRTMNHARVGSALKHFPGYGGNGDTHADSIRDTRTRSDFAARDFLPFKAGIAAGAPCILVCHNIVTCMDENNPASLSPEVHRVLREELNFDKVIMTDDLSMAGAANTKTPDETVIAAVAAGNDLLCTSHYQEGIAAIVQAVRDGRIAEEQITASALRVLRWKEELGLLTPQKAGAAGKNR